MRIKICRHAKIGAFFASFMLLQYAILRMGNSAGRGFLPDAAQEKVYLFLQVFAICGFFLFALFKAAVKSGRAGRIVSSALLLLWALCSGYLFFAPGDSPVYLVFTALAVLLLGFAGGNVYLYMAAFTADGVATGLCMGVGSGAALLAQYFFQLEFDLPIPLGLLMLAAFFFLGFCFLRFPEKKDQPEEKAKRASAKSLILTVVIAAAMLLFTGYYNSYIHHLQVASNYTVYNVYSLPRLLMAAGLILFGIVGDIKKGKYLPVCALCTVIVALLNAALAGKNGAYTLNMCLYYVAISAAIAYYDLTFWRAAAGTRRPAFWASFGRVLDSAVALLCLFCGLQDLSAEGVLALNVALLVVLIVSMAFNGSFRFAREKDVPAPPPSLPATPDRIFGAVEERYGLTPAELKVFKELVLTEDKQAAIGDRLSIKVRTVQANVTSIYRKTGVTTRAGLVRIYEDLQK